MATGSKPTVSPNSTAQLSPEPIVQVATGFMAAKLLFVANELGLFEKLASGPATLQELAERARLPQRTTRIVLDAMVALGFADRHGDQYQNSQVAATFLAGQAPTDLRAFLRFWNRLSYARWMKLEEAVRSSQPVFGELSFTPEEQRLFSQGVEAFTTGQAVALATCYDWSRHHRVLDLGGGTGSFLLALLSRHPTLKCTLFEAPAAAAVARQRLHGSEGEGKIEVVEGDFLKDPIPGGHDAVIIANVVHVLSPQNNLEVLRRTRKQVTEGAHLLLVDFWTDPTHTQPVFAALMAGEFLINAGGDVYSEEEARGWLEKSGWRKVDYRPLIGPASLLVASAA